MGLAWQPRLGALLQQGLLACAQQLNQRCHRQAGVGDDPITVRGFRAAQQYSCNEALAAVQHHRGKTVLRCASQPVTQRQGAAPGQGCPLSAQHYSDAQTRQPARGAATTRLGTWAKGVPVLVQESVAAIGHRASVVLHGEVCSRAARVPAEASIVGQILTQLGTEGGVGGLQVAALLNGGGQADAGRLWWKKTCSLGGCRVSW